MSVDIYGTPSCAACKQAVRLCEATETDFYYIDASKPDTMKNLIDKIGMFRSVPQIFVDGEHIGGLAELQDRLR